MGITQRTTWRHASVCVWTNYERIQHMGQHILRYAMYFLPSLLCLRLRLVVSWEVLFSSVRTHEINEGFFVTSHSVALYCLANGSLCKLP